MPDLKPFTAASVARFVACLLSSVACLFAGARESKPLITNGDVEVVAADFEAFLLRIPEGQRAEFRASLDRVSKAVELLYTNRILANEARREGLDKDPLVALRAKQLEEGYLAQVWQSRYQAAMRSPDMLARAREIYLLQPDRFREPERLSAEYIQVSMLGRTREDALARAQEARAKLVAGEPFDRVASLYSDDRNLPKNRGRIEQVAARDLEKPIADAAFGLSKPGDITQPVEAGAAFHLMRLVTKAPGRLRSFDEVKDGLIAAEASQFKGLETDRRIGELKNSAQTKVHDANILELVKEMTPAEMQASQGGLSRDPPPK